MSKQPFAGYIHPFAAADLLEDWYSKCDCGRPAKARVLKKVKDLSSKTYHVLCEGCSFRHKVMKAAGREREFWEARPEPEMPAGWVSYKVKYTASIPPDTKIRMRSIKAPESKI